MAMNNAVYYEIW